MPYPRYLLVPPGTRGVYHCVSRCVRRAFLCGDDPFTGRCFDHRKQWLEARILELGSLFAVAIHAYAVMSNHLHVVLEVAPHEAQAWSDDEVARRWLSLSQPHSAAGIPLESRIRNLLEQPERLTELRQRLGSVSWFMRYLKEPIAREANREGGCTGRFWEGRFTTQSLLEEPDVLATMVYVDLNPVRAGVSETPEEGPHTSLHRRIARGDDPRGALRPVAAGIHSHSSCLDTGQYLELVDWTGRQLHPGKRGVIASAVPPVLERLHARPQQWLTRVPATESRYWRAIGSIEALTRLAATRGQRWLRGIGTARALERLPHTT